MIRAVISDLGRVVLWFDNDIFLRKLAERSAKPFEDVKTAVHGDLELIRRFDGGVLTPEQFCAQVNRAIGANVPFDEFYETYKDIFSLNTPVVNVLARVKSAGFPTVLLSNVDPVRFAFIRGRYPEILFFDAYVLSYELRLLKPDPAIYLEAARRAGVPPEECVLIDDMERNVRGAEAAGLRGILYTPETDLEAELRALGLRF